MSRQGSASPTGSETRERPVREKFQKTTIDTETGGSAGEKAEASGARDDKDGTHTRGDSTVVEGSEDGTNGDRGRVRKKRSHEEIEAGEAGKEDDVASDHQRKKSREGRVGDTHNDTAGEDTEKVAQEEGKRVDASSSTARPSTPPSQESDQVMTSEQEAQRSPLNKRKFYQDPSSASDGLPSVLQVLQTSESNGLSQSNTKKQDGSTEPESKRKKDESNKDTGSSSAVPATSGFANSSAVSPFASLGKSTSSSEQPQTSAKAFAASGFASLASSNQSPFGSLGSAQQVSSFGSFGGPLPQSENKANATGFAALGSNPSSSFSSAGFGSTPSSGFGQLGAGAKSLFAGASGPLKSFATPAGSGTFGATKKAVKPFGSPAEGDDDDEDDGGDNDDGETEGEHADDDSEHQDSRFYEQEVETGEEDETTIFQARAKLFVNIDGAWKERGAGMFKVNISKESVDSEPGEGEGDEAGDEENQASSGKTAARFIMRADGSHRIIINSNITKHISVDDPAKGPPKGNRALFLGVFDGKPLMTLVRFKTNTHAIELHETVKIVQKDM